MKLFEQVTESLAVFCEIDSIRGRAENPDAVCLESFGEFQRSLPAERHDDAIRLFDITDIENIFECEWLKVEFVGLIVIGRDSFRIAIDHDRLEALFLQRVDSVNTTIIKLDSLSDPVRPATKDNDFLTR